MPPPINDPQRLRRLNALLEEALALPLAERARWLAGRAEDERTFVPELGRLLARAAVETDTFMRHPAAAALDELAAAQQPDAAGDLMGPWRLLQPLGEGGMATVWRAERADGSLAREVALKLPRLGWSAGLVQRMARERDLLAALEHPHIARLYDAGVTEDGRPWLAMEHVAGLPIDDHCRRHRLDPPAVLRLALQVCDALAHAHARLIVHRDLKPANILVTEQGEVRLLDFGVGKLLQEDSAPASHLTQVLGHALTPDYASPEQVAGKPVTVATDVYSLGVVLYELLTGQRPYRLGRQSTAALEEAILAADVPRASARANDRSRARALRGDLDAVLSKALSKAPAHRYTSVEALASDLRRHLAGEPVLARAPSKVYRFVKFVRRNRSVVASVAALMVAICAGLVGTLTQASRAQEQARAAQSERDAAQRELRFAEGSEAFLRFILSERSSRPFTAADLLARADALVETQYRQEAELRTRLQLLVASLYAEQRDYKSAHRVLERARASAMATPNRALRAEVECRVAELGAASGAAQAAEGRFEAAMRTLSEDVRDEAAALVVCHSGRASWHARSIRPQAAIEDAQVALRLIGTPRPAHRQTVMSLQLTIARAQLEAGQVVAAIEVFEQQLRVAESGTSGLGILGSAIANNLGVTLVRVGQWQQASRAYQRGQALAGPAGAPKDHALLVNQARLLLDLGHTDEAVAMLDAAQAHAKAAGDGLFHGLAMLGLAGASCDQQQWVRCDAMQSAARAMLQGAVPPERAIWAAPDMLAARVALAASDLPRAQQLLGAAMARFDKAKDTSPSRVRALGALARVAAQRGDHASAQIHVSAALDHAHQVSAGMQRSAWVGVALLDRAVVRRAQGRLDDARQDLAEALDHLRPSAGPLAPATLEAEQLARDIVR